MAGKVWYVLFCSSELRFGKPRYGRLGEARSGVAGRVRRSWLRYGSASRIMAGKVRYVAFRSVMLRYGRQG